MRRKKVYSKRRNPFEDSVEAQIKFSGSSYKYESIKIPYTIGHDYIPDYVLNVIIIEAKGEFDREDRAKHIAVREQHPEYDIRFVFYNANNKINKGSKTTYGQWCDKKGFKWCEKYIPSDWFLGDKKDAS